MYIVLIKMPASSCFGPFVSDPCVFDHHFRNAIGFLMDYIMQTFDQTDSIAEFLRGADYR